MKRGRCAAGLLSRWGVAVCPSHLSAAHGGRLPAGPRRGGGLCLPPEVGVPWARCPALRRERGGTVPLPAGSGRRLALATAPAALLLGAARQHRSPRPPARKSRRGQVASPCLRSAGRGWEGLLRTRIPATCEIPSTLPK